MRIAMLCAAACAAVLLAACAAESPAERRRAEERAAAEAAALFGSTTITFTPGRWDLPRTAEPVLRRASVWLREQDERMILIEGQGDARGTREYELALGARRAEIIKLYLMGLGVPSDQILTVSWGRERLVAQANSSRRVLETLAESPGTAAVAGVKRGTGLAAAQN